MVVRFYHATNPNVELPVFSSPPTLEELQKAVEGYLERVTPTNPTLKGAQVFVNEEGRMRLLPRNKDAEQATGIVPLFGNVVILTDPDLLR